MNLPEGNLASSASRDGSDAPDRSTNISIIVADDHPIFRRGLKVVIESDPGLTVVAEADDGVEALAQIERLVPDIAVLDIDMPGHDGLQVVRLMTERNLTTRPVFLTMHKDEAIFTAAIDAGVPGFVIKDSAANDIVTCIRTVMDGQSFVSSALSELMLEHRRTKKRRGEELTAAELRVLRLIAAGKTSREVAAELFLSHRTVEHHRARIAAKLELKGKNGLLTYALLHKAEILRS
jgi:DNA-binding NarL/FixJ family response regulator